MCNLYTPPTPKLFSAFFGVDLQDLAWGSYVAPLKPGPYLKADGRPEVGQWGMIAPGSKSRKPAGQTNNARRESLASRKTYSEAWLTGRRCLIAAANFQEPYYPGHDPKAKSIAWRFERADGEPWALAGIWSEWLDPATGNLLAEQDKRAVVPLERDRWDEWLHGSADQAEALIQVPPLEIFRHGAGDPAKNIPLPGPAANTQISTSGVGLF